VNVSLIFDSKKNSQGRTWHRLFKVGQNGAAAVSGRSGLGEIVAKSDVGFVDETQTSTGDLIDSFYFMRFFS